VTAIPGPLCVVERPAGKPYRSQKAPEAHAWDNDGGDFRYGVVVIRTQDVESARPLAVAEFNRQGWYFDAAPAEPWVGWIKLVPRRGDWVWAHMSPSTRGAVPCVEWECAS
jgi:hypothetical protein